MIIFIPLLILFVSFSPHVYSQQKDEFVLVKQEGSISIYERWITFPKSNPAIEAREVKGEFFFNNTIPAAIELLQNEKQIKKWQHHVSEFEVYKQDDPATWLEYSYHDIPWPVSDQDHFLVYTIETSNDNRVFISFESKEDSVLAPVRKGVTRMELSGSWTFEKISPTKIKATYRILSRPLNIPKFITDPIIRNNMMTTIQRFIALIDSQEQKDG